MSFNKNLDIDSIRTEHECEEHWNLRRMFLLKHKESFPEDRLVCLAQVFVNVEILGCRYSDEVMKQLAVLSEGIVEDFREKRKKKIHRTFVAASDAAAQKVKGVKRGIDEESPNGDGQPSSKYTKPISFQPASALVAETFPPLAAGVTLAIAGTVPPLLQPRVPLLVPAVETAGPSRISRTIGFKTTTDVRSVTVTPAGPSVATIRPVAAHRARAGGREETPALPIATSGKMLTSIKQNVLQDEFRNVILVENKFHECSASATLTRSLQLGGFSIDNLYNYKTLPNGNVICEAFTNSRSFGSAEASTKLIARETIAENVLHSLREFCYTIEIKANYISETTVDKSFQADSKKGGEALSDDNLGNKLLRMMGWSGGGLGKDQQGIETPISVSESVNRSGLGLQNLTIQQSRNKIRQVLENFISKDSGLDLAFSPDFTKDERAAIHLIAKRFNLKTKSHGVGEDRHLVVSKKERPYDILQRLIQSGGSTEKYTLIKPRRML